MQSTIRRRLARPWIVAALLGATVAGLLPGAVGSGVVRGAATDDIPGVPLPGPVATGRLGGAIYDVVYSIDVPAGHVIVASVTGTAGTDFDLYLFDSSATTVLSTVGLLTKSTGPTSTESISWPSQPGGRYYINLNGATDVEGDFRLAVQVIPDQTPPIATVAIESGRPATNQATMSVSITAVDDLSGVPFMAVSFDGSTFGDWQSLVPVTAVTLPPGDGPRSIWVKVRNGVGLESAVASDAIVLDTVSPAVLSVEPAQGSTVVSLRPTFRVAFNEPIDPATWADLGLIVQSPTGQLVAGTASYDPTARKGSFTPTGPLSPGATYAVTVGNVRDAAGNLVTTLGSWSVTAIAPTSLTVSGTPLVLTRGTSVVLEARLGGAPLPASLEVLSAVPGGPFEPLTSLPSEAGSATLGVTPPWNTTYRFRYGGAFGVAAAETDVRVLVRRSIGLVGRHASSIASARIGRPVTLTAQIGPGAAGVSLSFKLYRFDSRRRAWVYAGSKGRTTDASGRAMLTWTPTTAGSWYWRVAVGSTAEYVNNTSAVYRWRVAR